MKINSSLFSIKLLYRLIALLYEADKGGIKTVVELRQTLNDEIEARVAGGQAKMNEEQKVAARKKKKQLENGLPEDITPEVRRSVYQGHILCPECKKAHLTVKQLEGVIYTACPQCYKTVEFK